MTKSGKTLLLAALTPAEIRWGAELADKLHDDVDLTFEEIKILTRLPIEKWPKRLLVKVRDAINFLDFVDDDHDGQEPS